MTNDRLPPSAWASRKPSRRGFLAGCTACAAVLGAGGAASVALPRRAWAGISRGLAEPHRSEWFTAMDGDLVQCTLCPRSCVVPEGKRGHCEVRENRGGEYYSMVYGNPCAVNADPVEKKPFFHVLPATLSLSIATAGCNLDCKFCQNWEISQTVPELTFNYDLPPAKVVEMAKQYKCPTIASTYVEPTIFFEYMLDVAKEAKKVGILAVSHTNGYISREPLDALIPYLAAACVDLKGITEEYYVSMTGGRLGPVQETLRRLHKAGVHLELVNLIVPTHNDSDEMLRGLAEWVVSELGPDIPLHFSRFSPMYKLANLPPTPVETLERAREIALDAGLHYPYLGNVPGNDGENTICPSCKETVIRRVGYETTVVALADGACTHCGQTIPGIWA